MIYLKIHIHQEKDKFAIVYWLTIFSTIADVAHSIGYGNISIMSQATS